MSTETTSKAKANGSGVVTKKNIPKEQEMAIEIDLNGAQYYLNRELSTLQFQWRVFDEAADPNNPLMERLKFLAIVASNMDEFFMVRIGGLKLQLEAGFVDLPPDGATPAEQLAALRKESHRLMKESRALLYDKLQPELREQGIHILNYNELTEKQCESVQAYFDEMIFPVLTPLAFDPGHPFPHISNLSLNLAVLIQNKAGKELFARVKVPGTLPRLLPVKRSSGSTRKDGTVPFNHYFVWIEEVIAANLSALFPGMKIIAAHPFRVTRNADMVIQEIEADDLLETMEESVLRRRFGSVLRVTVNNAMPANLHSILIENMAIEPLDLYVLDGALGLSALMEIPASIERYDLHVPPFVPANSTSQMHPADGSIFAKIRNNNIILHHPYDSFDPVVEFLETAARDPNVLAIKQTLYRTGSDSPVVKALLEARKNGKQVAALIELKARFDEESNIEWARKMEQAGVHVTYGLVGLKTHSKIALVIRAEDGKIRRYAHLSTGNYNAKTAHIYEDIGIFTVDEKIGKDMSDLFNYLTGYSTKDSYHKLLVAPVTMRDSITALIENETENAKAGKKAKIIFKLNALIDHTMIRKLYEASIAGVKIELLVRGMCCLRPGVEGVSENITVKSVVGRFLEHSRIYYFHNLGKPKIFLGSADLMPRNLDRRIEVVFPLESAENKKYIRNILSIYQEDNSRARLMNSDGSYTRLQPVEDEEPVDVQQVLLSERT